MTLLGGSRSRLSSHGPFVCRSGASIRRRDLLATFVSPRAVDHGCISVRCRDLELSADDLRTWRGVVLGRAVSTLRSVETQPLAWGFVLVERRDPAVVSSGVVLLLRVFVERTNCVLVGFVHERESVLWYAAERIRVIVFSICCVGFGVCRVHARTRRCRRDVCMCCCVGCAKLRA